MATYDLITMGRISMDLFSLTIGAPFHETEHFSASVGGTPTNVAIGTSRLGLKTALITAVGDDEVGRFVRHYLQREKVETRFIPQKAGTRTGLALVGVEPPDRFPLTFYRENPADIHLTIDDVRAVPLRETAALLLSGTALSRGSCVEATLFAAELARTLNVLIYLDLDLRPDQWRHPLSYGIFMRLLLNLVNVVIGTEEEFFAALAANVGPIMGGDKVNSAQRRALKTDLPELLAQYTNLEALVLKQGELGITIYTREQMPIEVGGYPVRVVNTVGAGDAFASGLIYGRQQGHSWGDAGRLGNANGALVVTRHGCAAAMPFENELLAMINTGEIYGTLD